MIRGIKARHHQFRITVFGIDGSGKTSIVRALARSEGRPAEVSTGGFSIEKGLIGDLEIMFWDIDGRPSDRPFWKNYIDGSDTVIFAIDAMAHARLEEVRPCFLELVQEADNRGISLTILVLLTRGHNRDGLRRSEIGEALRLKELQNSKVTCLRFELEDEHSVNKVRQWVQDDLTERFHLS